MSEENRILVHLREYLSSRGLTFGASLLVITGQSWLLQILGLRYVWLFAGVSAALLISSIRVYQFGQKEPSKLHRRFALAVVSLFVAINFVCLGLLVHNVFFGSILRPIDLFTAGIFLWISNIMVFALAFWEVDGGGPEERLLKRGRFPDFVFPQQQADQEKISPADWTPGFVDYLYVSLTAGTAFSPTDAMPYTQIAKILMAIESTISFAVVAMLLARAINIAR